MTALLRSMLVATIFAVLATFSLAVHAEYYFAYPEPSVTYLIPKVHKVHKKKHAHRPVAKRTHCYIAKKHPKKHIAKRRSHYSITVTYVWPVCPGCACGNYYMGGCYMNDEQLNRRAVNGDFVTFRAEPYRGRGRYVDTSYGETYDMRTVDDDVMHYPDMNNQY